MIARKTFSITCRILAFMEKFVMTNEFLSDKSLRILSHSQSVISSFFLKRKYSCSKILYHSFCKFQPKFSTSRNMHFAIGDYSLIIFSCIYFLFDLAVLKKKLCSRFILVMMIVEKWMGNILIWVLHFWLSILIKLCPHSCLNMINVKASCFSLSLFLSTSVHLSISPCRRVPYRSRPFSSSTSIRSLSPREYAPLLQIFICSAQNSDAMFVCCVVCLCMSVSMFVCLLNCFKCEIINAWIVTS